MSERPSAPGVRTGILAACLVLACVTLACSVSLPEWMAEPTPAGPSPTITSDLSGQSSATLTLVNQSSATICFVYISPTTDAYWNDNWLDSGEPIMPGESHAFSVLSGDYDLRTDDCAQNTIETVWGMAITGDQTWTVGGATSSGDEGGGSADATLALANHSSVAICQVFISPATDDSWNDDWLGGQPIEPGDTRTFSVASGRYDLQATDCSGNELDIVWDTFISGSRTWQITDADVASGGFGGGGVSGADATLTLVNDSGRTICYVYVSPVTDEYWNDNWLGPRETIAPSESYAFSVLSGDYDLRADDCDHNQIDVVWGMSVTGSQTWTVP